MTRVKHLYSSAYSSLCKKHATVLANVHKQTFAEKLESHINKTLDCWIYIGKLISRSGRGLIYVGKSRKVPSGTLYVHEYLYVEKHKEVLSKGVILKPSCDNLLCVNPDHQFKTTLSELAKVNNKKSARKRAEAQKGWNLRKKGLDSV